MRYQLLTEGETVMKKQHWIKGAVVVLAVALVVSLSAGVFAEPGGGNRQGGDQQAEGPGGRHGGHPLMQADTDGDGKVSKAEFVAEFDRLDQNGDGYIEESELPKPPRRGPNQQGQ